MSTVTIRVPGAPAPGTTHRKITIKNGNLTITCPITSPIVTHSQLEPNWITIDRPGDEPLMRKGSPRLPQMKFDIIFNRPDGITVEPALKTLAQIANRDTPCVIAYGLLEAGLWWITAMPITSAQRTLGSNTMTKATVSLTCTRAPSNSYRAPTVTSTRPTAHPTAKPTSTTKGKTPTRPSTYLVKSGDTLTAISVRFYGTPDRYADIAKANRIKNPNRISPGQKLTLP